MKIRRKWQIKSIIASVSLLAMAAPLSIVLSSCSSGTKINYENIIKPSDNEGTLMTYGYKENNGQPASPQNIKNVSVTYSKAFENLLKNDTVPTLLLENFGKNLVTNWFAGIKYSKNHLEQYQKILEDVNKNWDDTVSNMKKQHGDSWQYFLQTEVLDQYGGLIENWFFNEISSRVISSFDSLITSNITIGIEGEDSSNFNYKDLFDLNGKVWKGWTKGNRNNLSFTAENASANAFANATADFLEYVFDQYVREKMPLITSMVLFKHEGTTNLGDFFDTNRIKQLPNIPEDSDIVGTASSYKWQAYPDKSVISSTGVWNSTDKYLNFINTYGNNGLGAVNSAIGGAININVRYTDDSATLYKINLDDVFETSFTPYASASTYKFNSELFGVSDVNVPKATEFKTGLSNVQGTEIMSNFMSSSAANGYFKIPQPIVDIMSSGTGSTPGFLAKYNGMKYIADIVNITGTPYILARNEAGVHIIGIDRLAAMQGLNDFDSIVNEIKNTLLWRHMVSKNTDIQDDTGFTIDLVSEVSNYYTSNKYELIYKYINAKAKQKTTPAKWESKGNDTYNAKRDIFSSEYTSTLWTNGVPKFDSNGTLIPGNTTIDGQNNVLVDPELKKYLDAYLDYSDYNYYSNDPSVVTSKIIEAQSQYTGKWYTNAVVENGIAGQSPYTTSYSSDSIVNNQLAFPSVLQLFSPNGTTKPTNNDYFKLATLKNKKQIFKTAASTYFQYLNNGSNATTNNLKLKKVEYPEYEQNAYLDSTVLTQIQQDTNTYSNIMNPLNISLNTTYSASFKTVAEIDKILAQIDDRIYSYNDATPTIDLSGYTSGSIPSIPSSNSAAVGFVNAQITNAAIKTQKIQSYTSNNASFLFGEWASTKNYNQLMKIAFNVANNDVEEKYSESALVFFKSILTLQYAFDWNSETGEYEFTKFRDFLVNSTDNFQKAAFVWKVSDYLEAFNTSNTANAYGFNLDKDFSFKNPIRITNQINGYSYNGEAKVTLNNGYYNANDVTLTQDTNYFTYVPVNSAGTKTYAGFKGIQFQSSNSLESQEATSLFSSDLKVNTTPTAATATWSSKGALYNLGDTTTGPQELQKRIDALQNWNQIYNTRNWLKDEFSIDVSKVDAILKDPNINLNDAKIKAIAALKDAAKTIRGSLFEPVKGEQIANSSLVDSNSSNTAKFFGTDKLSLSQLVVSQFNKYDVIKLFDTDGDEQITDADKGINWTEVNTNGFLGVSAEAFFISAYQWATADQTFASIAYNDMLDIQNNVNTTDDNLKAILVNTYTRPLNDAFGKDWAANYKEPVKVS